LGRKVKSLWAFNYAETPGSPIIATRLPPTNQTAEEMDLQQGLQAGMQYTIGYTQPRGHGRITMVGLSPSADLLLALYDHLEVSTPSRSLTPQISTALFRRAHAFYLLAVNSGNEDKLAEVLLEGDFEQNPCWQARNLISGQEWTLNLRESGRLTFPLPRKDGVILQLRGA